MDDPIAGLPWRSQGLNPARWPLVINDRPDIAAIADADGRPSGAGRHAGERRLDAIVGPTTVDWRFDPLDRPGPGGGAQWRHLASAWADLSVADKIVRRVSRARVRAARSPRRFGLPAFAIGGITSQNVGRSDGGRPAARGGRLSGDGGRHSRKRRRKGVASGAADSTRPRLNEPPGPRIIFLTSEIINPKS